MIYDYKSLLEADDETYQAWLNTIAIYERQALNKLAAFKSNIPDTSENKQEYAENYVVSKVFADDMSKSVMDALQNRQQEIEQGFRFGAIN